VKHFTTVALSIVTLCLSQGDAVPIACGYVLLRRTSNRGSWTSRARDQFVVRHGSDTEVFWNDVRQGKPELVYSRKVGPHTV